MMLMAYVTELVLTYGVRANEAIAMRAYAESVGAGVLDAYETASIVRTRCASMSKLTSNEVSAWEQFASALDNL